MKNPFKKALTQSRTYRLTLTEIGTLIDALTDMADENMRVAPDIDDLLRKLEAK